MRSVFVRPFRLGTVVALALFASAPAAKANLITNGSFESPGCAVNCFLGGGNTTIAGWTTTHTGVEYFNVPAAGGVAPDGVMAVDLANFTFSAGGIQQTFGTLAGTTYAVTFSAGNQVASGRDGTGVVLVDIAGQHFSFNTAVATVASIVWKTVSFSFTAIGSSTTLQFSNTQNAFQHFAIIDNVVAFEAVPVPASLALLSLGLLGLGATRRRMR